MKCLTDVTQILNKLRVTFEGLDDHMFQKVAFQGIAK